MRPAGRAAPREPGVDRFETMKVFVTAVRGRQPRRCGPPPQAIAGRHQPRHRRARGPRRNRTPASHHPRAEAERGRRSLCGGLPSGAGGAGGGRHARGRRWFDAARAADPLGAADLRRGGAAPDPRRFPGPPSAGVRAAVAAGPCGEPGRRRGRRRAAHRPHARLLADRHAHRRRRAPGRRRFSGLSGGSPRHPRTRRPGASRHHRLQQLRARLLDLPGRGQLGGAAHDPLCAAANRQFGARRPGVGRGGAWADTALFVPRRAAGPGRTPAGGADFGRAAGGPGAPADPGRPGMRRPRSALSWTPRRLACGASSRASRRTRGRPTRRPGDEVRRLRR